MDMRGISKDYIEISDKHLLLGDTLIDDYHVNLNGFEGRRILFEASHNKTVSHDEFAHAKAADWKQVIDLMTTKRYKLNKH